MKNHLLYPDCFSEESINRCRFALLRFLGSYNLTPPANISVIIHTNKAAAFEIFLPFFKEILFLEKAEHRSWNDLQELKKLLSGYEGNVLVCRTNGYIKAPVDDLYAKMAKGYLVYCMRAEETSGEKPNDTFFEKVFAAGLSTSALQSPSSALYTSAQNSQHSFSQYKDRREVNTLLKTLFQRNEEESTANLVKKARHIDFEAIEKEATAADKLPFYKRWLLQLKGKNPVLRQQLNKL